MSKNIHAYTSITANYLPKARVLAESIKRTDPEVQFHLILSDNAPVGFNLADEPFDFLITAQELVTDRFAQWAFGHSVVELCTAVKGVALEHIFNTRDADQVFYFDPDMVVFAGLDDLQQALSEASVVLTPHQTDPEITDMGILDNEVSSLLHGVFNLGFVGVRNVPEGRRFSRWWAQRLHKYCHDDLPRGLFTDQKWVNLAPCFFDDVRILRSPAYNVATWNITNRTATGSIEEGILINDEPLGFYHFSGFDSGDQITMLERYGTHSPVLHELRAWYIAQCEEHGQSALGTLSAKYDHFSDGTPIGKDYRVLYRQRIDLQQAFPNPFLVQGSDCYKAWYDAHPAEHPPTGTVHIKAGIPLATVLNDLARHFNSLLVSGHVRNPLKKLVMKSWVGFLRLIALVAGRGRSY
ncbi:MAG: hypothetical protein ACI9JM_003017 [Halioglobus sp.]|jgi:hypothetical protein